jgi:hypothetical protein
MENKDAENLVRRLLVEVIGIEQVHQSMSAAAAD